MKYLVNRTTKEHVIKHKGFASFDRLRWIEVKADSEGWIKHTGRDCPLPDDVLCDLKFANGKKGGVFDSKVVAWHLPDGGYKITHYRPILEAEPVQETDWEYRCEEAVRKATSHEPQFTTLTVKTLDLLDRLDAAHAAAQALPDLVEQLRDRLKPLGLSVMYLSEFDAVEPEPVDVSLAEKYAKAFREHYPNNVEPAEGMSDWRNWKYGDKLECVNADRHLRLVKGMVVTLAQENSEVPYFYYPDGKKGADDVTRFRFHSRPAKGE